MIAPAQMPAVSGISVAISSVLLFAGTVACAFLASPSFKSFVARQERMYTEVLRGKLLLDVKPRAASILSGIAIVLLAMVFYVLLSSTLGAMLGACVGLCLPGVTMRLLARRRLDKLNAQLVGGIGTLTSGVRAGLNLVQAMGLVAKDAPAPLRQEFTHLLREYEYGLPLEEAMDNAAARIGSGDFALLFAALRTHRQRGGDLGQTLERIAESIREIQRLDARVRTLTAQGRATARWLGAMPALVLTILYFLVDAEGVKSLFAADVGKLIIFAILVLNLAGFLWIKKIVTVDV